MVYWKVPPKIIFTSQTQSEVRKELSRFESSWKYRDYVYNMFYLKKIYSFLSGTKN